MDVTFLRRWLRETRGDARDSLDFGNGVAAHVFRRRLRAALLTEVDAAGELTNEHQVDAVEHFGLDRRRVDERLQDAHRPQVRVNTELLAQLEQAGLGTQLRIRCRPLRAADRAQQNRIRAEACVERGPRQRVVVLVDGDTAEIRFLQLEAMAELVTDRLQRLDAFRDDFGADAVATQYRDMRLHAATRFAS